MLINGKEYRLVLANPYEGEITFGESWRRGFSGEKNMKVVSGSMAERVWLEGRLAAFGAPPEITQAAQDALDAARWRFARRHWGRLMESYEPTPEGALDRIARIMIANDQQVRDGLAWDVDPESLDAAIDFAIATRWEI